MAQLPISNRRSIAPPPPPPPAQDAAQEQTLFDYILACITAVNPAFAPQGPSEDDNAYLGRICSFFSPNGDMTEEGWNQMDPEAQQWYNDASLAFEQNSPLPAPQGFYEEQPQSNGNGQAQAAPAAIDPATGKKPIPPGLARHQAEVRAKKEAAAAAANGSNGQAQYQAPAAPQQRGVPQRMAPPPVQQPQQAQAPAVPPRRGGPAPVYTPPPQPVAPQRRMAPPMQQQVQAPAVPQRRGAPAPAAIPQQARAPRQSIGRDQGIVDDLRAQVVYNPEITPQQLVAYARERGYPQVESSIGAIVSQVRSIMNLLDRMGYIAIPQG